MSIYRYKFGTYKSKVAQGKKEAALPYMTDNINSNIMLDYNVYISRCLLVPPCHQICAAGIPEWFSGATVCGLKIYGRPSSPPLDFIDLPSPLDVGSFLFAALDGIKMDAMMWDGMALLLIRFWDMGYGSSCFIMFHHVSQLKKSRPNQYLWKFENRLSTSE